VKKTFFLFFLLSSSVVISCQNTSTKTRENSKDIDLPEKGKVIADVKCMKDASISYSLYLPSALNRIMRYPLILAFDPHASGELPVEKYRALAEKYGYILMGSNNSKNGQSMEETQSIINTMFNEMVTRYPVDTSRIYLLGFSGGSRIASLAALYGGGTRGVIGCGAGFPGTTQPGRFRFDYIGMAGNSDFNMNELVNLDEQLDKSSFRHALIIFDGKHEWPEAGIMENAFIWNEFCAMKDKLIPVNDGMVRDFTETMMKKITRDEKQGDIDKKFKDLQQLVRFTEGLSNTDGLKSQMNEIQSSVEYKKAEKKVLAIRDKEMQAQKMFTENFYLKDIHWWKKQITDYGLRITNGKDPQEVLMYKRIMSYLSLLAYMKYSAAERSGEKEKADFAMQVYQIVDPENAAKMKMADGK
jgi:hypothetical protein